MKSTLPKMMRISVIERLSFVLFVLLILGSFFYPLLQNNHADFPRASNGVLDLSTVDPQTFQSVPLDGQWLFYEQQLILENEESGPAQLIEVPGAWNLQTVNGRRIPIQGFATYRLKIILPIDRGTFAIKTRNIRSANSLFVNGKLEGSAGVVGTDRSSTIEKNKPYATYFDINSRELDLILWVSSFEGFSSGISHSITFGTEKAIQRLENYYFGLDVIFAGGFLLSGLYFLSIYFQRRQFIEQLYFALFSLSIFLYFMTTSERLLWNLIPDISMLLHLYLQITSSMMVALFLSLYVYHCFPHLFSKRLIGSLVFLNLLVMLVIIFIPVELYFVSTVAIIALMVLSLLLTLYYLAIALIRGEPGSVYIGSTFLAVFILFPICILNIMWTIDLYYFLPLSLPVIAISQALYMAKKYTTSFETVTHLSEQLQKLDKVKDEFLAKTSHELKTPLSAIINISQSLLEGVGGRLETSQQYDIRLMRDIGKRLATLVNDILDYAKAKNQNLVLYRKTIDLYGPVRMLMDMFSNSQAKDQIKIVHDLEVGQFMVHADENRLIQIVSNLLDNALKYTTKGTVEITAVKHNGMVQVAVRDTGQGIAPDDVPRIFESFEQLEASLTRSSGGVGLGLAITKQLVELHGGTIWVESTVGVGSVFTFTLPEATVSTVNRDASLESVVAHPFSLTDSFAKDELELETQSNGEHAGAVLVVDDEISNLRAVSNLLTIDGYHVQTARDGEQALRLINRGESFDIVILDVMMPRQSGYEVCRILRESHTPLQLPILFLTARSFSADLSVGFAAGANDFIEKPFDAVELRARVKTLVNLKKTMKELLTAEINMLQSQIRPHFIYNVLSTVISLCYSNPERAATVLMDFSSFLRKSMNYLGSSALISLAEELEIVRTYFNIERVRFGDRVNLELQIDEQSLQTRLPALSIQPLVENAIKHGITFNEQGIRVSVKVLIEEGAEFLRVTVSDNGPGFSDTVLRAMNEHRPEPNRRLALTNLNNRLRALTGEGLIVDSRPGVGTMISFCIPLG